MCIGIHSENKLKLYFQFELDPLTSLSSISLNQEKATLWNCFKNKKAAKIIPLHSLEYPNTNQDIAEAGHDLLMLCNMDKGTLEETTYVILFLRLVQSMLRAIISSGQTPKFKNSMKSREIQKTGVGNLAAMEFFQ